MRKQGKEEVITWLVSQLIVLVTVKAALQKSPLPPPSNTGMFFSYLCIEAAKEQSSHCKKKCLQDLGNAATDLSAQGLAFSLWPV